MMTVNQWSDLYRAAAEKRIAELEKELEQVKRQSDLYRDMLKGISVNIHNMLRPIGGNDG